jgi:hypothetical protein
MKSMPSRMAKGGSIPDIERVVGEWQRIAITGHIERAGFESCAAHSLHKLSTG